MKEEKTTIERIKSASRVLAIILHVGRILCFVGAGIMAAGIIYVALCGNADLLILNGKVLLRSPYDLMNTHGADNLQIILVSAVGIVALNLLAQLFKNAREIFLDMYRDDSPFEKKQVSRIRKIAILYFIISMINFEAQGFSMSLTLNLLGIVGALMFWCISLVFEYGCELQQQSDETL